MLRLRHIHAYLFIYSGGRISLLRAACYTLSQMLGSILGAVFLWGIFGDNWCVLRLTHFKIYMRLRLPLRLSCNEVKIGIYSSNAHFLLPTDPPPLPLLSSISLLSLVAILSPGAPHTQACCKSIRVQQLGRHSFQWRSSIFRRNDGHNAARVQCLRNDRHAQRGSFVPHHNPQQTLQPKVPFPQPTNRRAEEHWACTPLQCP